MMCTFTLTVEVKIGMLLREVVILAKLKAIQLDMNIRFSFNGTRVFVSPDADIEKVIDRYHADCKKIK
ncbi:hypothetical protein I2I11_04150 [Pontibacter sp. 172403-2]|uniref:hypothetical protein n=1 Tax=Pontibacter rufus TaxID=2791028 RepID=UPI0018AFD277|nr:hypothetical protein [Pontibacter sp. 172403-2]MBF9252476.1 hypothetical protein [Pontibacter sp. 172403-2]